MDIDTQEHFKPHRSAFRVLSTLPPKVLAGSVLTLMPAPSLIITARRRYRDGNADWWQVLAFDDSGIVVATAEAPGEWDWTTHMDPEEGTVRATWHPLDAVTEVAITEVRRWMDQYDDGAAIRGRETWAITVAGDAYTLDPAQLDADGTPAHQFCADLIDARSASRSGT